MAKEIKIPEGYEARIEDNKVIIEPKKSKDERIRKRIINILGNNTDAHEEGWAVYADEIAWLKSLRPQSKQEWNKKDEEKIDDIIRIICDARELSKIAKIGEEEEDNSAFYDGLVLFLKSFRPQPQRKDTYYDIIHNILASLKDVDFMQITPEHRVSLLNDIRVKCKNADECAAILDEPHWKPSKYLLSLVKKVADGEMLTGVEQMAMGTLHEELKKLSI